MSSFSKCAHKNFTKINIHNFTPSDESTIVLHAYVWHSTGLELGSHAHELMMARDHSSGNLAIGPEANITKHFQINNNELY